MADSPVVLWQNPGEEDRGRGAGSAQKQEGCACVRVKVRKRFILKVFQLSKCFHRITKTPTTINHLWEMFYEINIRDWGARFLRCLSSFSIPLHSFSHSHCRRLFGLSPYDHQIKMQISVCLILEVGSWKGASSLLCTPHQHFVNAGAAGEQCTFPHKLENVQLCII